MEWKKLATIKGTDARTPIKGVDYFTDKELEDLNSSIKAMFKKSNVDITPQKVRDKLESLEGDARLDASAIKNIGKYASNTIYNTSSGGTTWGSITGTLSAQTDLQTVLNNKLEASDITGKLNTDGSNSMSGTLVSTVTTGTAPLTIASTTKVDNLNVDSLDGANLSTDDTLATNSDALIPSEKAVKTYVGNNLWTLSLGTPANGLSLTGTTAKELSLPETASVKLGSLNVNSSDTPYDSQILIPQGGGGDAAPGIKFIPTDGATVGGLSMFSGIAEFWNNFSQYTTPQGGKFEAVFRLDSRTGGYEAEAFAVGGRLLDGSNYQGMALNFSTGDAILCGYELGSVGIGRQPSTLGVNGKNGWLATQYTIKDGGGLIMKYLAKTDNYTLTETDYLVDCTANSFAITLPDATTWAGETFVIKNSGTGVITLNTTSSQTIDGNASGAFTLALQYDSITVMSNGANWIII